MSATRPFQQHDDVQARACRQKMETMKMETMKKSGKWEADLLEHTDEDQTWEQLTSLDEDED